MIARSSSVSSNKGSKSEVGLANSRARRTNR